MAWSQKAFYSVVFWFSKSNRIFLLFSINNMYQFVYNFLWKLFIFQNVAQFLMFQHYICLFTKYNGFIPRFHISTLIFGQMFIWFCVPPTKKLTIHIPIVHIILRSHFKRLYFCSIPISQMFTIQTPIWNAEIWLEGIHYVQEK